MLFSTAFDSERRIQIPSLKLGKNSKEFKCYYDQILFDKFHILPYPTTCIQFLDKKDNDQQQIGQQLYFIMERGYTTLPHAIDNH